MKRIREIDIMRTFAMLLMVVYHILYDLNNFAGLDISYYKPPLSIIGKLSALIFIFLSGVSSGLGSKPFRRGIVVFACGMLITLVTFVFFKERFVFFGILHLLGVCMVLSPAIKKAPSWILMIIIIISAVAGWFFDKLTVQTWVLLPFGITYKDFASVDYYPLFPYISVFMVGVIYYRIFYKYRKSIFNLKPKNDIIEKLSKNSLTIYLLHQPIILGIIYAVAYIMRQ